MTLDDFLAWEARQETKYEFDGFGPVAMAGGSIAHARIQRNLAMSIGGRLVGSRCEFLGSDLKIRVDGRVRYPDGMVVSTRGTNASTLVVDPVVIFEVLSDSTARTDIGAKNREYAATPSVQRYVVLEQDHMAGTMFERINGDWIGHLVRSDSILRMPEIGIEVPMSELYRGVEFDDAPPAI
jgi:Uma2 family endonuclease